MAARGGGVFLLSLYKEEEEGGREANGMVSGRCKDGPLGLCLKIYV